jgi:hypothetical protein
LLSGAPCGGAPDVVRFRASTTVQVHIKPLAAARLGPEFALIALRAVDQDLRRRR